MTSGASLTAEHTHEAEEDGPPPPLPPPKKSSVAESLTAQEQKLVNFYASHPLFYDQTLPNLKNKAWKDHLQNEIGKELGITGKC